MIIDCASEGEYISGPEGPLTFVYELEGGATGVDRVRPQKVFQTKGYPPPP